MNLSKVASITIPEGKVASIHINNVLMWQSGASEPVVPRFTNQVPLSTDYDGITVFNGSGYQDNMRVRSGGALGSLSGYAATGFIPVKAGDVIRFTGVTWTTANNGNSMNFGTLSAGSFTSIGSFTTLPASYGIFTTADYSSVGRDSIVDEGNNIYRYTIPNHSGITHMRMSGKCLGTDMIITINEEITL